MTEGISLTPAAQVQAQELAKKEQNKGLSLRLYLDGKGCDGFYYGVTFSETLEDDIIFNTVPNVPLLVDQDSYKFCKGSVIDWVNDERGVGFLVENPNHRKFRGKFYKRQSWKNFLEKN